MTDHSSPSDDSRELSLQELLDLLEGGKSVASDPVTPVPVPAVDPDLARQVAQVVLASQQRVQASLQGARADVERHAAEAQRQAEQIRQAAAAAADAVIAAAHQSNVERLRAVERQAQAVLSDLSRHVRQVLAGERVDLAAIEPTDLVALQPADAPDAPAWVPAPQPVVAAPSPDSAPTPAPAAAEPRPAATSAADAALGFGLLEAPVVGGVEVAVGPFARFTELAAFTQALRTLDGVQSAEVRQFYRKVVYLRVRYDGEVPLATRLADLREFMPSVSVKSPNQLEVHLERSEVRSAQGAAAGNADVEASRLQSLYA